MVGVGKQLWRSPSPTPVLKEAHLEEVAQDHVRAGFEYLQRQLPGLTQGGLSNLNLVFGFSEL